MRLQIASDLHLEFVQQRFADYCAIEPAADADALILAGDIHSAEHGVRAFANWPVPVYLVPGNHEAYGRDIDEALAAMRRACEGTRVTVLNNDWDVISRPGGGRHVRILGSTLWTDYALFASDGLTPQGAKVLAERHLRDHVRILERGAAFTAAAAEKRHRDSLAWLEDMLDLGFAGPTVVVTHHGPHPASTAERFAGNALNPAFLSDLSTTLDGRAALWVHGHVHDSFDYEVGGTRVVANPRGYAANLGRARNMDEIVWENPSFQSSFVVEV